MKTTSLTLALLLVSALFASTFVLAEDSVSLEDLDSTSLDLEEIKEELSDLEDSIKGSKRVGFANVVRGHGSIDDGESGHLIAGFWVSQNIAAVDSDGEVTDRKNLRSHGGLKIPGQGNYKLLRSEDSTQDSPVFDVYQTRKKLSDVSERESIGSLSLEKEESFEGLTKWSGSLVLDSTDLEGSWSVDLATSAKTVRHHAEKKLDRTSLTDEQKDRLRNAKADLKEKIDSDGDGEISQEEREAAKAELKESGAKRGFWSRFAFWRDR